MTININSQSGNGGVTPSRSAEFSTGLAGGRSPTTPTLDENTHASVLTEKATDPARPFTAAGVLQPLQRFSNNGISAGDASRHLLGDQQQVPMKSYIGGATDQNEAQMTLRLNGSESAK